MLTNKLGKISEAKITDMNQEALFAQIDGTTLQIDKAEADLPPEQIFERGQKISGFVYENKHHEMKMAINLPTSQVDQFGFGTVSEIRRDLGVFVNIGLPDKDMVVSLDDLPLDTSRWPKVGDRVMMALKIDHKDRIWGQLADEFIFEQLAVSFPNHLQNHELTGTVYATKQIGAFVITQEYYLGFIHESEMYRPLRLGEQVKARVIGQGAHGRLNLSLLPLSYEVIDDDALMILTMLKRKSNRTLPFSDKSSPTAIKEHFGISKASFKRAIGHLLKQKMTTIDNENQSITLFEHPDE